MDPMTAKAVWGLFNLWRLLVRVVWPVVREIRAQRRRKEQQARWEQEWREAAVVARGRGWTMRDVDDA